MRVDMLKYVCVCVCARARARKCVCVWFPTPTRVHLFAFVCAEGSGGCTTFGKYGRLFTDISQKFLSSFYTIIYFFSV